MALTSVRSSVEAFLAALDAFDPDLVDLDGCAAAVTMLSRVERVVRAKKAHAARRATYGGVRGRDGSPDAAHWLAQQSGESVSAARAAIETVEALRDCPATRDAVASGDLSLAQAKEIASAELARPGSEDELIALARRTPMATLRDEARKKRLAGVDADELHRRQHRRRRFRTWTNDIGNLAFTGELPPDVGVPIVNRLDAETDRLWRAARRAAGGCGEVVEPREAYAADALAAALAGEGRGHHRTADVVIVVDLKAWRRGEAADGEVCHIVGGGGIPVAVARRLAVDAFFKAIIHDGENILTVAHLGRHMKAELRTALDVGPPPDLAGVTCCEAGCGRRHGLQWDHVDPVANNGPTRYSNLKPRCIPHHREKTERDRRAGLLGPRRSESPGSGGPAP